ncbi:CsbD family protein [Roseateles sp.]|uniref:CsbD family protein n=1 Tax=Roseateles sp. TaxID=1971397 RepID=UPI003264D609
MNSDQVKGSVKDVAGKVQRKVGEAIGSTDQQVKGAANQIEGKAQKAVGDTKEVFKDVHATTRTI